MKNPLTQLSPLLSHAACGSAVGCRARKLAYLLLVAAGVFTGQAQSNPCASVPSGVVGWWRAENNGADASGTNAGTLSGGSFTNGVVGKGFQFDGVDDRVIVADAPALNFGPGEDFSMEGWVQPLPSVTPFGVMTIIGKRLTPDLVSSIGYELYLQDGKLACQLGDVPMDFLNFGNFAAPGPDLRDGAWHHVAVTVARNATDGAKLYVDGQLIHTFDPTPYAGDLTTTEPLRLGENSLAGHATYFKGLMDEFGIYRRALSPAEILAIYNAGSAGKCADPNASGPILLNVDFGAGLTGTSKTGFAAIGQSANDFWNFYTREDGAGGWRTFGALSDLKSANGATTAIGLAVINAPGAWGNGSSDPMYVDYIYPFDGGNVTVVVSNLPAGNYDVLAYGYDGNYEVFSAGQYRGVQTNYDAHRANPPVWTPGLQYVHFTNMVVALHEPLVLTVRPGRDGYAVISGMQIAATVTNGVAVTNCTAAAPGLVSWWPANAEAVDIVGGNNGSLLGGATYVSGKVGPGFGFNGTDSYANISSSGALKPTGPFTFEAWIKYSGNPGAVSSYCIAAKGIDAEAAMDWALTVSANSRLRPHVSVNGSWHYFDCNTPLSAGTWYHVALIYDGAHLQGYVNGALDGSANVLGSVQTSDAPLRIGAYAPVNGTGSKAFFTGSIDEVAFYNRNLSAGELLAIFNAGSAGKCPPTLAFNPTDGLIAHYPFNGNAADVSGNGNHGVPNHAVLAPDRFGVADAAYSFNGQNAAIAVADNPALRSLTSNYTFNAWVRFGSNPQIDAAILMKSAGAGDQRKWTFWRHVQAPPYGIGLLLNRTPGGQFQWNSNHPFTTNQWFMVTFSASPTTCLIAVDGQVVSVQSGNLVLPDTTGLALAIGGAEPAGNQWFNGLLDDLRIYNRTFTSNEIAQLYQLESGPVPPPPQLVAVPVISSFSPTVATIGSSVIMSGTNFSPVAASNVVYFGAVQAAVSAASSNSLTVIVPTGATHAPITVTVNGLTAEARSAFLPSFVGNGSSISVNSFAPGQNLTVADGPLRTIIADLDGDGKPDLVEANAYAHNISLFRNISAVGTLNGGSFAPRVDYPTLGGTDSPRCLTVADVDGDGKLDILIGDQATSSVLVYRNIATPGTLTTGSFAAPVSFAAGSYPHGLRVADLNGDGLPEILVANHSGNSISILRNIGSAGSLTTNSFAPQSTLAAGPNPTDVAIADFNGDGQPDLVTTAFGGNQLSIFRNVATPGAAVSNWFMLDTTLPALAGSLEFALADMDGDAKTDLIVASVHGYAVSVYRNLADAGAFNSSSFAPRVDFSTPGWAHNVVVGDFNGDGKPDLAVTGELGSYLAVFQNQSTPGNFTASSLAARVDYPTGWNAWGVAAGDLDGDNRADIVFANIYDDTLTFYRNIVPLGEPTNPPPAVCVAAPAGLVGWWPGENQPTDVLGALGGGFLNGTGFGPGKVGQALYFDGVNDSLTNAVGGIKSVTNSFTMEFWAWPNAGRQSTAETYQGIAGISGQRYAIYPDYGELGPVGAGVSVGTNGISVFEHGYVYLSSLLTYDAPIVGWTHIAVVYSNAQPSLHVNGQPVRTGLVSTRIPYPSTRFGEAGADSLNYGYYSGGLDEISIYNRALTPTEIQSIYNAGSAGKCPTTNPPPSGAIPAIATFGPTAAPTGSSVTIVGTNFSPAASSNIVYFGAVRANVTAASSTSLIVTVPVGATHAPITVTVAGLTAAARTDFTPTFAGGTAISPDSFSPRVNLGAGDGPTGTAIADFDGDGKPDLAVTDNYGHTISLYRNISVAGTLDASSFAPRVALPANAANYSPYMLVTGDVDGDGKLDLITTDIGGNTVSVYRNQSGAGSLSSNSFAPFVSFATSTGPRTVALVDLDADGRPEMVTANYDSSTISVLRNTSVAGQISSNSFAPRFDLPAGAGTHGLAVTDLDGDGRPDLATANAVGASLSLFRNFGSGPVASNSFAAVVTIPGPDNAHFIRAADLDADGRAELLVTSYLGQTLTVYRNQANPGSLTSSSFAAGVTRALAGRGHTISLGDLNGDARVDIAVDTEIGDSIALFQNQSAPGGFTSNSLAARVDLPAGWNAWGSSVGDLDGDGRPDIIFANTYDDNISIYRNVSPTTNPPVACAPTPPGLVASWRAEGDAVDSVSDTAGALENVSFTAGVVGQAFVFNQGQTRVSIPDRPAFVLTNSLSIEGWIYPTGPGWTVFWRGDNRGGLDPYFLQMNPDEGNILQFIIQQESPNIPEIIGTAPLAFNQWYHIAATLDDATGAMRIYTNGVLAAETNTTIRPFANLIASADASIGIGNLGEHWFDHPFVGHIDEISLYSRALAHTEIQAIYTAGSAGKCAPTTPPTPPQITQHPQSLTTNANANVRFSITATGNPAPGYQWFFNYDPMAGETNAALLLNTVQTNQTGDYFAIVTNPYGAVTSSVATLTVLAFPPTISRQPTNVTVTLGQSATLSVQATGTAPLSYQWFYQDLFQPLIGKTSPTLTLPNAQLAHAGNYFVIVGNPYGAVTSALATLTVALPPNCAPAPAGIVAWWPGQSNLWDVIGGNDAMIYQTQITPAQLYTTGKVSAAFSFLNSPTKWIVAPPTPELNVGVGAGFTFEAWVYRTPTGNGPIFGWGGSFPGQPSTPTGVRLQMFSSGGLSATLVQTNGSTTTLSLPQGAQVLGSNTWSHVALSCDNSNRIATLYVNGQSVGQTTLPGQSAPISLRTVGLLGLGYAAQQQLFGAILDEPTLYNRALSQAEIQSVYAAQQTGKCPPPVVQCVDASADLVGWWRGESNTLDSAGMNHGQMFPPSTQSAYGVGQFGAAFSLRSGNYVVISNAPGLNLGAAPGLTVEAWINPTTTSPMPIVEWNSGTGTQGVYLAYSYTRGPGYLEANLIDSQGQSHLIQSPFITPTYNLWKHVAVSYDRLSGMAALFVDGFQVTQTNLGSFTPRTSGNLYLGYRPPGSYSGSGQRFTGLMDEVAVYRRALSAAELRCLMRGGVAGKLPSATDCAVPMEGLVSWWRGETNALDSVQNKDGLMYPWPLGRYTNGQVGLAFATGSRQYVIIRSPLGLNVGAGAGLTVEGWINPASTAYGSVFGWGDSSSASLAGVWLEYNAQQSIGSLRANLITTNGLSRFVTTPGGIVKTGQWQHVALTYDRASGWAGIFVNGTPVTVTNLGSFTPRTTGSLYLGWREGGSYFMGALDEMAVHDRALTSLEISAIARATNGRCLQPPVILQQPASLIANIGSSNGLTVVAAGNPLLHYQWFSGQRMLSHATNATLSFSNFVASAAGTYFVRITNSFGTIFSSNAVVQVNRVPVAQNDALATPSNTPAIFPAAKLTLNDSDADGDPLTVINVSVSSAQTGTVSLVTGTLTYMPPPGFVGNDLFTYTVTDHRGGNAVGNVMVTVGSGGAAPLNIVSGPTIDGSDFRVRFAGIPGLTYTIEAAPSLAGPWIKACDVLCPETNQGWGIGIFEFSEPIGTNSTRFYRTIYPPY